MTTYEDPDPNVGGPGHYITEMLELDGGAIYASDASRAAELAERHARIDDELLAALERQEELTAGR